MRRDGQSLARAEALRIGADDKPTILPDLMARDCAIGQRLDRGISRETAAWRYCYIVMELCQRLNIVLDMSRGAISLVVCSR